MQNLKMDCFQSKGQTNLFMVFLLIDLTLEQTINANEACQRTGISAMKNSISARQRLAQSHCIRTRIIMNPSKV